MNITGIDQRNPEALAKANVRFPVKTPHTLGHQIPMEIVSIKDELMVKITQREKEQIEINNSISTPRSGNKSTT